jgi:hypothetical protein
MARLGHPAVEPLRDLDHRETIIELIVHDDPAAANPLWAAPRFPLINDAATARFTPGVHTRISASRYVCGNEQTSAVWWAYGLRDPPLDTHSTQRWSERAWDRMSSRTSMEQNFGTDQPIEARILVH